MRVPIPYLIFKVILQPYALLPSKHLRPLDQLLLPASVSLIALFATFIRLAASSWDNPALTRASFRFLAVNSDIFNLLQSSDFRNKHQNGPFLVL